MKSNLIHALLATVLLASCSQEDVIQEVDTSQSAIGFSTFVDKATRATTTDISNFTTFMVWGTKFRDGNENAVRIMNGIEVTKSGNDWTYSPIKYWINSNAYSFTAIGSSTSNITDYYTYTAPSVEHISYDTYLTHYMGTLTYNNKAANGNADLIWASEKVATLPEVGEGPSSVKLTFGHLLSRVRLKFVNNRTKTNPADVTLKNVKITSASSGTLDFSQNSVGVPSTEFKWKFSSENFDCGFNFDSNSSEYTLPATGSNEVTTNEQFLIPSQQTITVSFDCYTSVTEGDGDDYSHINITKTITFGKDGSPSPFMDLDLKPGYSYTLVAYLTDELDNSGPINLSVEINPYIEVTAPVYAMEFAKPKTVSTFPDDEKEDYYQTISVNKITSVDELVYYGNSTTTPASAPTRSSDSTPTVIDYTEFTYKWSIPKNVNYSFDRKPDSDTIKNVYEKIITPSTNSANSINVVLHVKGNYSPNGSKKATNIGYIPVTLSMINKGGKVVHYQTVYVEVEYTVYATGGSQDGDDNDG